MNDLIIATMDDFASLFEQQDGIEGVLTLKARIKANDEYEQRWAARIVSSRKPQPPPTPPASLILHFDAIDPANNNDINLADSEGFFYGPSFWIGKAPPQPGLANLLAQSGRARVGWQEFSALRIARGNIPGAYPLPGNSWNVLDLEYAPGNHNNSTVRFEGRDSAGTVIHFTEIGMSSTTPQLVTLNFTNIHELHIYRTVVGDLDPGAAGPVPAHWYGGIVNMTYELN